LLSLGQHIALLLTVLIAALVVRRKFTNAPMVVLVILYAAAVLIPRPMASLSTADAETVKIDFHSHTNASSDARRSFTVDKNREWHRRGGFDVAYISDHRNFAGAEKALRSNPTLAGDRTVLLSAYEGRYLGTYQIFLMSLADSAGLITPRKWIKEGTLRSGRTPVSVIAMPGPIKDITVAGRDSAPHYAAIEISDGSPRGFAQIDRDRALILQRADSLGLSFVSGSNNHGWGRVVPAWTLIRIPGWRRMSPDSLGASIEASLRNRSAVRVVERVRPTLSSYGLALTLPVIVYQLLSALTMPERLAWILWIWVCWALLTRSGILYARREL
jgi:hypothetical protein